MALIAGVEYGPIIVVLDFDRPEPMCMEFDCDRPARLWIENRLPYTEKYPVCTAHFLGVVAVTHGFWRWR